MVKRGGMDHVIRPIERGANRSALKALLSSIVLPRFEIRGKRDRGGGRNVPPRAKNIEELGKKEKEIYFPIKRQVGSNQGVLLAP